MSQTPKNQPQPPKEKPLLRSRRLGKVLGEIKKTSAITLTRGDDVYPTRKPERRYTLTKAGGERGRAAKQRKKEEKFENGTAENLDS